MKKGKKFISFALIFAMVLSLLSACGSTSDTSANKEKAADSGNSGGGKITLTAWHGAGGESAKFLEKMVKEYNDSQKDVEIKLVYVDTNNMVQKLTAAAAGNALPQLGLLMWPQWFGPLKEVIRPLDDMISAEPDKWNEKDFLDSLLDDNVRFNGKTYGVPIETNNLAIYYNKQLFNEAGVQPPKTWDELISVAQKLTNPEKKQWGIEIPTTKGGGLDWIWDTFLWQAGGEYANKEGSDLLFNSDAGKKATQLWVDMVNKYKVASLAPPQNGFQTGRIAMTITGPWSIPTFAANENLDFGIAPLPEGPAGKATNIGGTSNLIFKSTPEKEKAAWDFLMWLSSTDSAAKFAVGYGTIPIRKSALEKPEWQDFVKKYPGIQVHIDSYKFGKYRPYNLLTYNEIADVVSSHVEAALQKKETPEEAMKKAYDESKPLVKSWLK